MWTGARANNAVWSVMFMKPLILQIAESMGHLYGECENLNIRRETMAFRAVPIHHFLSKYCFGQSSGPEIFWNSEQKVSGCQFTASVLQSALESLMLPNKLCASLSFIWYGIQHLPQLFPPCFHLFYFKTDSFEISCKKSLKEKTWLLWYRPPNKHHSRESKNLNSPTLRICAQYHPHSHRSLCSKKNSKMQREKGRNMTVQSSSDEFKSLRDPWVYSATQRRQVNLQRQRPSKNRKKKKIGEQDMLQREVTGSSRWNTQEASHHNLRNIAKKIITKECDFVNCIFHGMFDLFGWIPE